MPLKKTIKTKENDDLWNKNVTPNTYGQPGQYYEHALEQYKIYIETIENVSSRRASANTFFLTLHTLLLTSLTTLYGNGSYIQIKWVLLLPLFASIVLCWAWWRLIKSYKQLNNAKFQVIDMFESELPTKPFVNAEWKLLRKGQVSSVYRPLTDVETVVPSVFAILYCFGILLILFF